MRRSWIGLVAIAALLGCGGDSSGPSDPFPAVAGTYQLDGGFDGLTRSEGSFTGTLVLTQASRQASGLGGTVAITAEFGTDVITLTTQPIVGASVTPNGAVTFQLTGDASTDWTFTGTRNGSILSGRHTLTADEDAFSGDWTGTRAGATAVASARSSAAAGRGGAGGLAAMAARLGW